jgi:hypothetical protein
LRRHHYRVRRAVVNRTPTSVPTLNSQRPRRTPHNNSREIRRSQGRTWGKEEMEAGRRRQRRF